MRRHVIDALPGYEPEIGRWLAALEEVRRGTLRRIGTLEPGALDWEGPDGRENSIGTLLYHLAVVESSWLFLDVLGREFPPEVAARLPHPMGAEGRLTRVAGLAVDEHVDRLAFVRTILLESLRGASLEAWRTPRRPVDGADYEVTAEWAVFHLIEHEAGHGFQIAALAARWRRSAGD